MRKLAIFLAALMVLATPAALAAQRPGEMDEPLLTTHDVVATADALLAAAKSYEANVKLDLALSAEGESLEMDAAIAMKAIVDPFMSMKMSIDMDVSEMGESASMDMYIRNEGDTLAMYAVSEGEAIRLPLSGGLADLILNVQANPAKTSYKSLTFLGMQSIGGKNCYAIEATPDTSRSNPGAMGMMNDMLNSMGLGPLLDEMLPAMDEMKMTLYIDAKTYQYVRMEADLARYLAAVYAAMGMDSSDLTVSRYALRMDYRNFDRVKKFDVPASVLKKAAQNDLSTIMEEALTDYDDYDDYDDYAEFENAA